MRKSVLFTTIAVLTALNAYSLSEPTIDRITFTGNLPVSSSSLLNGSGLHEGVSVFMVSSIQVRDAIRANLMSYGYLDCSVTVNWPRWGSEFYDVEIVVDPGPLSIRGELLPDGVNMLSQAQLEDLFPVNYGEPVKPSYLSSFRRAVLGKYSSMGYLNAVAEVELESFLPDSSNHHRNVIIVLESGEICYLGDVSIIGNQKVRPEVVLREFELSRGDPIDMDAMRSGLSALYSLGLFSSIQIDYLGLAEERDTIDVIISVTEQDHINVDIASGYISPKTLFGSVYWTHPNIMGNNQLLRLGCIYTRYISSDNSGNELEPQIVYEEPWFLSTRWRSQLKLDYYYLERDYQEERSYGGEVNFSREFARVWRYNCGYRMERLRYRSTEEDSTEIVQDWVASARISNWFTRDTRTPLLNPRAGSWFKIAGSVSGALAGGSIDFYTVDGEYRGFFPLNKRLVLGGRVAGSVVLGYSGNTGIPPNDRLYLGGGTTVRGYDFQTLGPEDEDGNPLGGNVMFLGNVEARLSIWRGLGLAVFADVGGIWTGLQQISIGTTGFGTGLGIRYDTPIGPIRLDYGFAPTWSNSLKRGKVYFAIGQAF